MSRLGCSSLPAPCVLLQQQLLQRQVDRRCAGETEPAPPALPPSPDQPLRRRCIAAHPPQMDGVGRLAAGHLRVWHPAGRGGFHAAGGEGEGPAAAARESRGGATERHRKLGAGGTSPQLSQLPPLCNSRPSPARSPAQACGGTTINMLTQGGGGTVGYLAPVSCDHFFQVRGGREWGEQGAAYWLRRMRCVFPAGGHPSQPLLSLDACPSRLPHHRTAVHLVVSRRAVAFLVWLCLGCSRGGAVAHPPPKQTADAPPPAPPPCPDLKRRPLQDHLPPLLRVAYGADLLGGRGAAQDQVCAC